MEKLWFGRILAVFVVAAFMLVADAGLAIDKATYEATYLQASDLPGFTLIKDAKHDQAIAPSAYNSHGGEFSGIAIWVPDDEALAIGLAETRFAFSTAVAASQFMKDAASQLGHGHARVADAEGIGEESMTFAGEGKFDDKPVQERLVVFRVGSVVAQLNLTRQPDAKNTEAMLSIFAGKANKRMSAALNVTPGRTVPSPVPTPDPETTLTLPVSGLTVTLPGEWKANRMEGTTAKDDPIDHLTRTSPSTIHMLVSLKPPKAACAAFMAKLMEVKQRKNEGRWLETGIDGYYAKSIESLDSTASTHCATVGSRQLVVIVDPSLSQSAETRRLLATVLDATGAKAPPAPATIANPSPTPSPSPSSSYGSDSGSFGDDFMFPHMVGIRVQLDGAYIIPADAREEAFGFALTMDGGFTTGRVIGFATDFGLSMGYDFDGNVPFDGHLGIGVGLGLGPVSIAPVIGLGGDTRGGADDPTISHTMDAAFYWYPGGRLRLAFHPIAIEGWAAAPFRGNIAADQAPDISNQVRVVARVAYYDDEAFEYFAGFRYTRYVGATDDNGVDLFPDAEQFGGVLGVGFSMLDEIDE